MNASVNDSVGSAKPSFPIVHRGSGGGSCTGASRGLADWGEWLLGVGVGGVGLWTWTSGEVSTQGGGKTGDEEAPTCRRGEGMEIGSTGGVPNLALLLNVSPRGSRRLKASGVCVHMGSSSSRRVIYAPSDSQFRHQQR